MEEWKPTPELRYILRSHDNKKESYTWQQLQQKWVKEDNKSMKQYFEWRDVPTEKE